MAENKVWTSEETITLIRAKKEDSQHGDSFLVKVFRRSGAVGGFGGKTESLTTLGAATVQHIVNPEIWIPKLAGGGNFILKVFANNEPGKQLGGDLIVQVPGEPIAVNPAIVKMASWNGPAEMLYPEVGQAQSAPAPYVTLPNMTVVSTPSANMAAQTPAAHNVINTGPSSAELELKEQLRAQQAMLAQMQSEIARRDSLLNEERAARRDEQLRREQATALSALEAKLDRLATATPAKSPGDLIATVATALTPLVQAFIQSSSETRQIMLKAQSDNQATLQALMVKSMEKPAIDPQFAAMLNQFQTQIERLRESDPESKNVMSQMADAFGGMMNMSMEMMKQVAESGLMGGKSEPIGMTVVKEIAKAIESFGRASAATVGGRRRLPARTAPTALPQPPVAATATGPQQPIVPAPTVAPNGFAGVVNPLDEIEQRIRNEEDPKAVAAAFIACMGNPVVQAEIEEAGGIVKVFTDRLSEWANDHVEYGQELLAEIERQGIAAGVMTADGGGAEASN